MTNSRRDFQAFLEEKNMTALDLIKTGVPTMFAVDFEVMMYTAFAHGRGISDVQQRADCLEYLTAEIRKHQENARNEPQTPHSKALDALTDLILGVADSAANEPKGTLQ